MAELLLAQFETPEALAGAARRLRDEGNTSLEAYTPYSTEPVRDALGARRSKLPFVIFLGGVCGAAGAYFLQWLLVARLYPLNVGGRPPHMPLAFVPITFEMGVLLAALTAFAGVLVLGKLVKPWDPVFEVDGFESASADEFWLSVGASGTALDALQRELEALGARRVIRFSEEPP